MTTMFDIDKAAQAYSQAHDALRDEMQIVELAISGIKDAHHKALRKLVAQAADKKAMLGNIIKENPALFASPKTRIIHGVKLGFRKGSGKLDWDSDELVVKLIKKKLPEEMWEILIKKTEKPRKDGLNGLDVNDLKKIGVTAEDTGDQVVIKPTDSEIDKLVDALLAEAEEPEAA
ncbi:MAG: host-nuclease inhibitor Gam family protein [Nitrospirota bacterium]